MSKEEHKRFRQIGHALKPIVSIGSKGLTDAVASEVNRALNDHELIKIKLPNEDRETLIQELSEHVSFELIQLIGNVALIYRQATNANPKLSNLLRHTP